MEGRTARLIACLLALAAAGPAPSGAAQPERATVVVASVVDGDTLDLADGRRLRLAGIEAAKPPPGPAAERRWPLAEAATAMLADLVRGRPLVLRGADAPPDRHGRIVAQAWRADGVWLQGALIDAGHARVRTQADDRALAPEMLEREAAARLARRGIWATAAYAVRPAEPEALRRDADSFQIVEGRVRRADSRRGQLYLDFGDDWRTDVTASLDRDALKLFRRTAIDPASLAGRRLRVRGWVAIRNGPMVAVTHPEQVEVLDDPPAGGDDLSRAPDASAARPPSDDAAEAD